MIHATRRLVPLVLAFAAAGIPGLAQAPRNVALATALESIHTDNIRADIFFLASDELGGRDTPSTGQKIAARYIRARLMRLGFTPGTPDGYFFKYKLQCRELNFAATHAQAVKAGKSIELSFGSDYAFPSSGIASLVTAGNVVYAGEADDKRIAGLDLAGKWALVEETDVRSSVLRDAAKKAGAVGLLVTTGPKTDASRMDERIQAALAGVKRPNVRPMEGGRSEERGYFPSLSLSADSTRRLFELGGPFEGGAARPAVGTDLGVVFTDTRKEKSEDGTIEVENVCGLWPGSDPALGKEVIIISAHYDHVGTSADGTVYNGADDNGSGTTGLLQLAEALSVHGPMRRSVLLLWVSGEEKGLWGSQAWCRAPSLPETHRAVCDINIDMIGRNAPDKLLITPTKARTKDYNGLTRLAESLCAEEGFPQLGSADEYWSRSDHANFARYLKVPVAFLFSDVHEDYHQPTDDPEKIDCDKIRRVSRLVLRMIDGLQTDTLSL